MIGKCETNSEHVCDMKIYRTHVTNNNNNMHLKTVNRTCYSYNTGEK